MLADFAETDPAGKVHILGAGWSVTGPQLGPQAVVGFIQVPPEQAGGAVSFTLRLADRAGEVVEVQGPAGMLPMELGGQVEVREPEEWDGASDLNVAFAVNVTLPLPPGQSYTWSLEVDGKDLASTTFYVRSASPGQQAQPEPQRRSLPPPCRAVQLLPPGECLGRRPRVPRQRGDRRVPGLGHQHRGGRAVFGGSTHEHLNDPVGGASCVPKAGRRPPGRMDAPRLGGDQMPHRLTSAQSAA